MGLCLEICGDGIRVSSTIQCDDGNMASGDGCSSDCEVETNFKCSGGSSTSPDICTIKKAPIPILEMPQKNVPKEDPRVELAITFQVPMTQIGIITLQENILVTISNGMINDYPYTVNATNATHIIILFEYRNRMINEK